MPGAAPAKTAYLRREQRAQHERQNTAVLVVVDFDRRIDAQQHLDAFLLAILAADDERQVLLRLEVVGQAFDVERFLAGQAD